MSRRLPILFATLSFLLPSLSFAGGLAYPTKPWVAGATTRPAERTDLNAAPSARPMEMKPALWNRVRVAPPALLASDTAQDSVAWRDLATKPSRWIRPDVARAEASTAMAACAATCACHRG